MKRNTRFPGRLQSFLFAILLLCLLITRWLGRRKSGSGGPKTTPADSYASKSSSVTKSQQSAVTPKLFFDREQFATSPAEFKPWYSYLFDALPFPLAVTATMTGVLVFLGGLLLSSTIDFQREYIETPAIYIGSFGIAWVLAISQQATLSIHRAYEELRPCYLVDDQQYRERLTSWFNRMVSHSGNLIASLFFFTLALVVVYIGLFRPDLTHALNIKSLRPALFFPPYWFTPDDLMIKALIIGYYGLCVALPLGTTFRLMVLNLLLLLDLRHLPVIPAANIIRARLHRITNLYIFISGSWFVGVALFGAVFFRTLDVLSASFLSSLSLVGILVFLTPQVIFRRYLARSYRLTCDWSLQALNSCLGIQLQEKTRSRYPCDLNADAANLSDLASIIEATSKPQTLIYDAKDFLVLIGGQFIVFASAFFQSFVEMFLLAASS